MTQTSPFIQTMEQDPMLTLAMVFDEIVACKTKQETYLNTLSSDERIAAFRIAITEALGAKNDRAVSTLLKDSALFLNKGELTKLGESLKL